jgi:hypothetical protein
MQPFSCKYKQAFDKIKDFEVFFSMSLILSIAENKESKSIPARAIQSPRMKPGLK